MVAALAAPLAAKGVRIGALMGTAYLFTQEAVATGAIVEGFQKEALECRDTVLLESGPGHATRCAETAFNETFRQARRKLLAENKSSEEIREALEDLNLGRLRIASKGITRAEQPGEVRYRSVPLEEQVREGMYMIGQVAALRHAVSTISELHAEVAGGGSELLKKLAVPERSGVVAKAPPPPADVAIVGLGCLLPQAPHVRAFWTNVLHKVDAISEVPRRRFDVNLYFDPDRKSRDKIYSRWGGFLEDVPFDPMRYGIPPNALASIDPLQLLALVVVDQALRDAGYDQRDFPRERTSAIFGLSGGLGDLGIEYAVRSTLPSYLEDTPPEVMDRLAEWTEDSFAGLLLNVAAGRVANRFNLGGVNFTVDAACASSLAAVYLASRELSAGTSDMVIVGGVDTAQSPFGFLCFSKAQALSPTGRCRTFDEKADGIAISEGITMVVLKRLEDAERDGDRIYGVIKGVAGSSDGRGRSMTAPRLEGQELALRRAYAQAGFAPSTVSLIEAHGTGTVAGDEAEMDALAKVFGEDGAAPHTCAIGSVKSMVGHTKSAAGVTGLMKVALALHHKILPPTLHVERPNPRLRDPRTPFFVNVEPHPWVAPRGADGTIHPTDALERTPSSA
jgi:3-oxoacyl-(acyl-carrier-protein) synthase